MPPKSKTPDFATTLAQIETLVTRLEDENTSLEQSLKDFELGIKLTREAQKSLASAEQKVQLLMAENDEPVAVAFAENEDIE